MNGQKSIGNFAPIRFINIGNKSLNGKVDTGAEISSMHVDKFDVQGDHVVLSCSLLSDNSFTLPLVKSVTVRNSDGGTESRPVIKTSVDVNGTVLSDIEFTLNNRAQSENPVLIGQNILQAGKFVVDPSQKTTEGEDPMNFGTQGVQIVQAEVPTGDVSTPINVVMDTGDSSDDPINAIVSMIKNSNVKCWEILKRLEELNGQEQTDITAMAGMPAMDEPSAIPPEQIKTQQGPVETNAPSEKPREGSNA